MPRYLKCMGFRVQLGGLVGVALLGLEVIGCGQVVGTNEGGGAAAGSNPLPAATDPYASAKSGERVQALGYVSEGVAQFRTLHDERLDFDCEFATGIADDELHCVPKLRANLIFLDALCSQPATWVLFWPVHVGDWLSVGSNGNSSPPTPPKRETFELGEEVYPESTSAGVPPVFELEGTTCVAIQYPPAKGIPAVNRLIPHADSELVAAKLVSLDARGGLRLRRAIGEDGSELTLSVTNAKGEGCRVDQDGCVPITSDETGPFPATQRTRQGSGAVYLELISSSPGGGDKGVPVGHYPSELDFLDAAGNRCNVVPAVDGTLRCATLEPMAYESGYADPACTQRLYYGQPAGVDPSTLHAALRADKGNGPLTATSSLKVYTGPAYNDGIDGCVQAATAHELLELDQRVEVSVMPQVFETPL